MARPPLVLGTWGKINRAQKAPNLWVAYARFRDYDGVTRQVERTAPTGSRAEDALKEALRDRARLHGEEITADALVRATAEQWFVDEVKDAKAYNTERRYREVLDLMVLPSLGALRIREVSVARCDRFIKAVTKSHGPSAAKHAKTVLSGVLGLATRLGALDANPIRDVATVHVETKEVEAMTLEQVQRMRIKLYADEQSALRDIPNGVDFMLGTSARIGEAMACRWVDIDLESDVPTVLIRATVIQKKGSGAVIQEHTKRSSSRRLVPLPEFAVQMLRRRAKDKRHDEYVFPSARGKVRDPNNFRKGWDLFRAEGEFAWVHPHIFRKTAAALVEDPELAAGLLGHADSRVTKAHYLPRTTLVPDVRDRLDAMGDKPAVTQRNHAAITPIIGNHRDEPGQLSPGQTA